MGSPILNNSSRTDPVVHQPHSLQTRSPGVSGDPLFSPGPGATTAVAGGHSSPRAPMDPSQGVAALNLPQDFPPHGSQTPSNPPRTQCHSASPPWTPVSFCTFAPRRSRGGGTDRKGHRDTIPHVCPTWGHTGPTKHRHSLGYPSRPLYVPQGIPPVPPCSRAPRACSTSSSAPCRGSCPPPPLSKGSPLTQGAPPGVRPPQ